MNVSWLRGAALTVLTLSVGACATAPPKVLAHGDDREVIHEQDMASLDRLNTFQVVQRLKPQWLRPRGQQALLDPTREGVRVYLDGMPNGGTASLQLLPAFTVGEIRFLDARKATLTLGTGHADGAILVTTRRGARY